MNFGQAPKAGAMSLVTKDGRQGENRHGCQPSLA